MRAALAAAIIALTAPAAAQTPDPGRMAAIWAAAGNRMDQQVDIWFNDGDFPRAISLLRFMGSLDPKDYETATNLGWLLENTEAWDEALAVYIAYRNNNKGDSDGPYPEAFFYYTKKVYAKIPRLLEPTLPMRPHPNSYRILAHSYDRLGLYADARRVWQAYLAVAPDDGAAKVNLQKVERKLKGEPPKQRP